VENEKSESVSAELRNSILHCFQNSSNTADSVEWIVTWWGYHRRIKRGIQPDLKQVLEQLITENLVVLYWCW